MRERIVLGALPARAKPLDEQQMSAVFGGCGQQWAPCTDSCDCCQGYGCSVSPPGGGKAIYCYVTR
jgi:hypothetical protein